MSPEEIQIYKENLEENLKDCLEASKRAAFYFRELMVEMGKLRRDAVVTCSLKIDGDLIIMGNPSNIHDFAMQHNFLFECISMGQKSSFQDDTTRILEMVDSPAVEPIGYQMLKKALL